MIKRMRDGKDMSIFNVINDEFNAIGIKVLPQDKYIKDMIAEKGTLTKKKPSRDELADAEFGITHAKKLATMDIGQTLVVRNRTIISVEAVEGTNETIRRGGSLCGGKGVVCKASRQKQDKRFDIPGIGIETLEVMAETGLRVLALEADKILIVDRENVIDYAGRKKISIVGI